MGESISQNEPQLNSDLDLQFKTETLQAIQPIEQMDPTQAMPTMTAMPVIPDKQMKGPVYTQFRSSSIGPQRDVPFQQSQSPVHSAIHTKTRSSLAYDFAQPDTNTSFSPFNMCDSSQASNVKNSPFKQKYVSLGSPEEDLKKFAVPKSVPIKQKSRARSISTPHINKDNNLLQSFTLMPPQAAISLTDIHSARLNHNVERSTSLPVYTHERRRSVTAMPMHINRNTGSNTNISSNNLLYPPQQQANPKLSAIVNCQSNIDSISVPSFSSTPSHQLVLSNAYNISQGSSSGSTLIARLLTSNSLNNISNITPQIYSTNNQSAASIVNLSNTSNNRSTTIDASCIGIRAPVTSANEKPQFLFAPDFKDANLSTISGQMHQNIKPNFVFQSTSDLCSPTSQVSQMPSLVKSRSSPVGTSSSKDVFIAMPSTPSPPSFSSQLKVVKTNDRKTANDRNQYKEYRRVSHINAEQKRRCNIKNGFDTLRSLLPSVSQNTNTKISKAAMLQKAADYIRVLKNDRQQQQEECDLLKQQVESLNQTIG